MDQNLTFEGREKKETLLFLACFFPMEVHKKKDPLKANPLYISICKGLQDVREFFNHKAAPHAGTLTRLRYVPVD